MYDYLNAKVKEICEAIDAVGLTTPPDFLRDGVLQRMAEIDQQLSQIKLALVTYNDPDSMIHEFGVSAEDAVETLAGRRDRLVKFLEESGLDMSTENEDNSYSHFQAPSYQPPPLS